MPPTKDNSPIRFSKASMQISDPLFYYYYATGKIGLDWISKSGLRFTGTKLGNHKALFYLGWLATKRHNWKEGGMWFSRAAEIRKNHAESHFKLGFCKLKERDWKGAEKAIAQAVKMDPSRSDWKVQLSQARSHLPASSSKTTSLGKESKGESNFGSCLHLLRVLLLDDQFDEFDRLIQLYKKSTDQEGGSQYDVVLFERLLAEGRMDDCAELLQKQEPSAEAGYLQGILTLWQGSYQQAGNLLLLSVVEKISPPAVTAAILRCSSLAGKSAAGLDFFARHATNADPSRVWFEAARLPQDGYELERLLTAWKQCSVKRTATIDRLRASAYLSEAILAHAGAAAADSFLAEEIEAYGKGRMGEVPRLFKSTQGIDYPNLPTSLLSYNGVSLAAIRPCRARYERAAAAFSLLLAKAGLRHCALRGCAVLLSDANATPDLDDVIEFGVFDSGAWADLAVLLDNSAEFTRLPDLSDAQTCLSAQHIAGVRVRILHVHEEEGRWSYGFSGAEWSHPVPVVATLRIKHADIPAPSDITAYLKEFGWDSPVWKENDFLLRSHNLAVQDAAIFKHKLALNLVDAIVLGDEDSVIDLISKIHQQGESRCSTAWKQSVDRCETMSPEIIARDKPLVILYVSGISNVAYQANMWIPVLEKLDVKSAICIRERGTAKDLLPTKLPVYFADSMRDLELFEQSGVRTFLYPANTQKNTQSLRFYRMNHFFINHGESDKVVNKSKFLMAYDKLLVGGPLACRRLEADLPIREGQVIQVGRPQTELMLHQIAQAGAIKTILYAPTWEGFVEEANYASICDYGIRMLTVLASKKGYNVLFKPHPFTGSKSPQTAAALEQMMSIAKRAGMKIIPGIKPIFECMNESDLMITDVSSTMYDYVYTLKPMILTNSKATEAAVIAAEFPSSAAAYVLDDPAAICGLLDEITENDVMFETRKKVRADCLGDFPEGSLARFNRIICESVTPIA